MAAATRRQGLSDFVQFEDETILWTASLILLKHLQQPQHRQELQGKRVLELGSGLGHLGMGLFRLGAHVTCTERPKELAALQESIARQQEQAAGGVLESALALFSNGPHSASEGTQAGEASLAAESGANEQAAAAAAQPQGAVQGSIQAVALEWGEEGFNRSPLSTQQLAPFDFIICSELYYIEALFPLLLWTLNRFAGPNTVVWSVFIDRPFSFMYFSLMHDEGCWDVEAVEGFDDLGLDSELQVHMHRIRRKALSVAQ